MPRNVRELLAIAAAMTLITVVVLFPQVRRLDAVPQHTDPVFSIWRLAWVAHQLPSDPAHLYDANIFFPERDSLANSDAMLLTGVVASPLFWLGLRPVVVYNVLLLASFVLSGVAMFALVRSLTSSVLPAFVAGVAFAFFPFRLEHYEHLELLSAFWTPLVLLALHRVIRPERQMRDAALLGALLAAQYHASMYFGVYLATYLVVVGGVLLLTASRVKESVGPLLVAATVAAALIAPSVPPYLHVRASIGDRQAEQVDFFSARPSDYISPHQPDSTPGEVNERQVYPGLIVIVLAIIGLWPPITSIRWAYLAGLALAFEVSLGSHGFLHPILFDWVMPFRGLRVPARFAMMAGVSLSILAGFGAARLFAMIPRRTAQLAIAAGLCGVILFEGRSSVELKPLRPLHPVYAWLQHQPVTAMVEVPVTYDADPQYQLASITHWRRMVNGSSGSYPKSYRLIQGLMRKFPDALSMSELTSRGVSHVVVHEEFLGEAAYRALLTRIENTPPLTLVHIASDGRSEVRVYKITTAGERQPGSPSPRQ